MKRYSWIFALIMVLAMAFVFTGCPEETGGGKGGGGDNTTPTEPPRELPEIDPDAEGFTIKLGTEEKTVEAVADKGEIEYFDDGSGYRYTYDEGENTGYGNAVVRFKITLPAGEKLGDYEKITGLFTGISGDVGQPPAEHPEYTKNLFFLASDSDFVGRQADSKIKGAVINTLYFEEDPDEELWNQVGVPTVVGNAPAFETEIVRKKELTGDVWIAVYLHATDGVYAIQNITFVKREAPEEFKPVTSIEYTGVDKWYIGIEYDLTGKGKVTPSNATYRDIVWSSDDVSIVDGKFTATEEGKITITATIKGGKAEEPAEDYVKTFTDVIEIVEQEAPAWFDSAVGSFSGFTVTGQGDETPTIVDADGIIDLSVGGGSALFIIDGLTGFDNTKTIKISYVVWLISGEAKITLKNGAWGDIATENGTDGCNWYPTLNATSTGGTLELKGAWYAEDTTKISFQRNGDTNLFKIKIIGIVIE